MSSFERVPEDVRDSLSPDTFVFSQWAPTLGADLLLFCRLEGIANITICILVVQQ